MFKFVASLSFVSLLALSPALAAPAGTGVETAPGPATADDLGLRPSLGPGGTGPDRMAMTLAPLSAVAPALAGPERKAVGPKVIVRVDLSEQRVQVVVEGKPRYDWPVSTGRKGYGTPTGFWTAYRMHKMWHSRKYDNAPMPNAIFFHDGFALHATDAVRRLGKPASHGCVRLHPDNAAMLYALARQYGMREVRVSIQP